MDDWKEAGVGERKNELKRKAVFVEAIIAMDREKVLSSYNGHTHTKRSAVRR